MSKNKVQFQPGYSLPEFFNEYGTEEQCTRAIFLHGNGPMVLFVLNVVQRATAH